MNDDASNDRQQHHHTRQAHQVAAEWAGQVQIGVQVLKNVRHLRATNIDGLIMLQFNVTNHGVFTIEAGNHAVTFVAFWHHKKGVGAKFFAVGSSQQAIQVNGFSWFKFIQRGGLPVFQLMGKHGRKAGEGDHK